MRRVLWICLILVVLVAAILVLRPFRLLSGQQAEKPDVATVTAGVIAATVNATGSVDPIARVSLSFETGGRVTGVLVDEGQAVSKGEALAQLDSADVRLSLRQAEASLQSAEARLAQTSKGAAPADVEAAEAGLASTQASLNKLLRGPTADETATARANLDRAEANVKLAQAGYDRVAWMPNIAMLPQSLQLQQASIEYAAAQANYRLATQGPSESAIRAAEASVAQARASLARLKSVPASEDVTVAKAQVEQARVSVEQARRRVEATELIAPFSGVVEDVRLSIGQTVGAFAPVIVLVDLSAYEISVDVDETDVRELSVGQIASITLDALPSTRLTGRVTRLSPAATLQNSVVTYIARVSLDPTDAPLRAGMSANVAITVARRDNAVLLSNRGIQVDRDTGQKYVLRLVGGKAERLDVRTGIRDDFNTEILSGLQPGDEVVIVSAAAAARDALRSSLRGEQ